jgi:hypothetical protein
VKQQIDLGFQPHAGQQAIEAELAKKSFGVVVAHRRFGKTIEAIMALVDRALRCKLPNPRYAYLAPKLKQAKQIAWMYLSQAAAKIPGSRRSEGELYVEMPNGARITLYGGTDGNEESMRGVYLDGIVIDEVKDIAPHVWSEIVRPALTDRKGWALFIGTPGGMNIFHELWQRAQSDPEWFALMFRVDETHLPWLPPAEIEAARRDMSDAAFRQEFLCDFTASSSDTLITIDLASAASQRDYHERDFGFAPVVFGVDVARFGDDSSVIQIRQGLVALKPIVFQGKDNMQLASIIGELTMKYQPRGTFIDAGGGAGVIDRLRQLGHRVSEINFGGKPSDEHYCDKRAEMWFATKEWLERGGSIENDPQLKTDLCGPTYWFESNGKIRLESKDDLKARGMRSPDRGDALALTFAMPVFAEQDRNTRYRGRQEYAEL